MKSKIKRIYAEPWFKPALASCLRHIISLSGGAAFVFKHDNIIVALASLAAMLIPPIFGFRNAYKTHSKTKKVVKH